MYTVSEQPIQGARHVWLYHLVWVTALHHHRVKDTAGTLWAWKSDREFHVWQMRRGFLTGTTGKAMDVFITSDLSLSEGAMRIARHLDSRCEMQSTLVYCVCTMTLWAELRDMYHHCKWLHKVKGNRDSRIHLQMGKETYRIRIIRQTRGCRSKSDN